MQLDLRDLSKMMTLYLELSEYPIVGRVVREKMREQLFSRGVITRPQFMQEVHGRAMQSREQEGIRNESQENWRERLRFVVDQLTDFYFAQNLPHTLFQKLLKAELTKGRPGTDVAIGLNPELTPVHVLLDMAEQYEQLSPDERRKIEHHLQRIYVVLTRIMVSDQINIVGLAREHFTSADFREIYRRRIGQGKIGGKSSGLMMAYKLLQKDDPADPLPIAQHVVIPESHFLGADVFHDFVELNGLTHFFDAEYRTKEDIEAQYPKIQAAFAKGRFPDYVTEEIGKIVAAAEGHPLIVRSSSLLEDNFGKSFAGKYVSLYYANQGKAKQNVQGILDCIRQVYASTLNPDALFYRKQMGLVDYNERMGVLIQNVEGARFGKYYFPAVAGVGFGLNPFRWTAKIRREDGFLRIVWGLGTRAVDRVGGDYPRMVALSHPTLRPEASKEEIRAYSQKYIDLINLESNKFETLPVEDVIRGDYPGVEYLAAVDAGDYLQPLISRLADVAPGSLVLTFERLLQEKDLIALLAAILQKLGRAYGRPVDIEFTLEIKPGRPKPTFIVHLLQCRPLSAREESQAPDLPENVPDRDTIFTSRKLVPDGSVAKVEYVVYVDPAAYAASRDYAVKSEVASLVGKINKALEGRRFILMGPGRWGSSNIDLGVKVRYADIYNSLMLVEVGFSGPDGAPELSYGTHFFQDLVESNIYALALYPDEVGAHFNRKFLEESPNILPELLPESAALASHVRVIDVAAVTGGLLEILMNGEKEKAIAFIRRRGQVL